MHGYRLKNYYTLATLRQEAGRYPVVVFDLYETLLLWEPFDSGDLFHRLSELAEERWGMMGFSHLRARAEQEVRVRLAGESEDIRQGQIYEEVARQLGSEEKSEAILRLERELIRSHTAPNPLMKQVYDAALAAGTKIILAAQTTLPHELMEEILRGCGFTNWDGLFLSGELGRGKAGGGLYRAIMEAGPFEAGSVLYIGQNDLSALRMAGMVGYHYQPLRERFFRDCEQVRERLREQGGILGPERPREWSFARSLRRGRALNRFYTSVLRPNREVIVRANQVSMLFNMSSERIDSIKEYFIKLVKRQLMFQEFWALRDVSFTVRRGERLGLVGLNGSGKSTMLKVVSGVLKATKGSVEVCGAIAPLIELGAGFDFDLSAKENVYLNGAILGYSHTEMEQQYEQIIEFAQLREFENVPIKNYSSGMVARLGFAIATCHTPDVLIIDEILSVGDFEFQKKCHAKMTELTGRGTTVLFVSHSAGDIVEMCDRAIWLDHGRVVDEGEAEYIVGKYLNQ